MSIILRSNDGESFNVTDKECIKSKCLKNTLGEGKTDIYLSEIKGDILSNIVKYLNYYAEKDYPILPETLKTNDLSSEVTEWDFSFINPFTYEDTFLLISAADSLNLDHLYNLACLKIAAFMKGKSPQEVNEEFTIECQVTPEQAKALGLDSS